MKKFKFSFFFMAVLAFGLTIASCGNQKSADAAEEETTEMEATEEATEEAAEQGPEYTSAYVCPMHCEGSGSAEPGKCPVCGMDYVMNEDKSDAEGGDGHDHDGHNH